MLTGKKVLVIGLAKSGKAAVRLLLKLNATITLNVNQQIEDIEEYQKYIDQGITIVAGGHPDDVFEQEYDFVIKNPGINYHKPFILRLKKRGIPVYTEIELAYQVAKKQHYIAVTGTNGKTTTVMLLNKVLKGQFKHVHLAGNVGTPLCDIVLDYDLLHQEGHYIVLEMSNFQLLDIDIFRPEVATIINLTPDHLDYMDSLEEYYASKTNIYKNQSASNYYIDNIDDATLREYTTKYPVPSKKITFSLTSDATCCLKDHTIYFNHEPVITTDEIKVVGDHNLQNSMVVISACKVLGVATKVIHDEIASFAGVEHRIEFVKEYNGIKIYNDSKATNTDATIIALKAFKRPVILLMGGFDKGLNLEDVKAHHKNIKSLITFGVAGPRFLKDMNVENSVCAKDLKEATLEAMKQAKSGDIILLSPSTSSFDEFTGYEQRGNVFKEIIYSL